MLNEEDLEVFHDAKHEGEDPMQASFRASIAEFERQAEREGAESTSTISMLGMFAGSPVVSYLAMRSREFSEKHPELAPEQLADIIRGEIYDVVQRCKFVDYLCSDTVPTLDDEDQPVRRCFITMIFRTKDDFGHYEYRYTFDHDTTALHMGKFNGRSWSQEPPS